MKGSDTSGVLSIVIGHKEYILSPLCVQEETDELKDSKMNQELTFTNSELPSLSFLKE